MVHAKACLDKAHFDKATLSRVNSAFMVGVIGSGLLACAAGAALFDIGRLVAMW